MNALNRTVFEDSDRFAHQPEPESGQGSNGNGKPETERRIYPLLVTQIYDRSAIAVIGSVVNALIVTFILRDQVVPALLLVWLALMLGTAALRFHFIRKFRRAGDARKDYPRWGRRLEANIAVSGILWGSCALIIFPEQSFAHQAIIAFLLAGMVAGAVGVFSPILRVFLAFSLPALLPVTLRFLLIPDSLHLTMGVMLLLFATLTFATAKYINASIREMVLLKETFVDQLAQRTAELINVNEQLRREIQIRHYTEAELREGEARFRTMADNIAQFAWMADPRGWIFWYNKRWYEYTGATPEEMNGEGWKTIQHPDHLDRVAGSLRHSWDTGEPWEDTMPLRGRDGTYRWFLSRAQPIHDEKGQIVRWFGTNTDITELLRAEEQIKKSLKEKEMLLREIHHRVKNNMQVIISLMNLQAGKIMYPDLKIHFQEAAGRVSAMALIHDILYRSDSLNEIDLSMYFRSLTSSLSGMYNASSIAIEVVAGRIHLDIDRAIPCGLIINELVSNALKHAFPGNRPGEIRIEAVTEPPDDIVLTIADTGVGLPEDFQQGGSDTLGLKLVRGLAENQLDGKVEVRSGPGTVFMIKFPASSAKE